jgi:hypothetical protein
MTDALKKLSINSDRMLAAFNELAQIGATGDSGVHRPTFSEAHLAARSRYREQIEKAGLEFRTDGAGNHSTVLALTGGYRNPQSKRDKDSALRLSLGFCSEWWSLRWRAGGHGIFSISSTSTSACIAVPLPDVRIGSPHSPPDLQSCVPVSRFACDDTRVPIN